MPSFSGIKSHKHDIPVAILQIVKLTVTMAADFRGALLDYRSRIGGGGP
jgi:hypothetical protein